MLASCLCAASDDPRTLPWPPYLPSVAKGRPAAACWFEGFEPAEDAGGVTQSVFHTWGIVPGHHTHNTSRTLLDDARAS